MVAYILTVLAIVVGTTVVADAKPLLERVDRVKDRIIAQDLAGSMTLLSDILADLKDLQQAQLSAYFPDEFETFTQQDSPYHLGDDIGQSQSIQILLSKQYRDKQENTIDVNLVFSDPSIAEFQGVIDNPDLLESLENTSIMTFQQTYQALVKYFPDDKYYECNIIINKDTLLNIVANGIENKDVVTNFCAKIKLDKIDSKLRT